MPKCRKVTCYSVTNNVCYPAAYPYYYSSYYLYYPPPVVVAYPTVCWTPVPSFCAASFHAACSCQTLVAGCPRCPNCQRCQRCIHDSNTRESSSTTPPELTPRIEDVTMSGANGNGDDKAEKAASTVASGEDDAESSASKASGSKKYEGSRAGSKSGSKSSSKAASQAGNKSEGK